MPNHIYNKLTASARVIDSLRSGDELVDFSTVIPQPGSINAMNGLGGFDISVESIAKMLTSRLGIENKDRPSFIDEFDGQRFRSWKDEQWQQLRLMCEAIVETGYATPLDWSRVYWSTKWNAYQAFRVSPTEITFQTAWSAPTPVIDKLIEMNPGEAIELRYADEDFGCNVGTINQGGSVILANNSREAYAQAIELVHDGALPDYYTMSADGIPQYVEE